ncbi:MAG TPA: hypothetical protein VMG59_00325 [Phycisphaerae bacterium]|nr:hypothetical protein [Phycisphaerae bacterium]
MAAWVKIIIYFTLCMQLRAYWKYIPISYDTTRLTSPVKQDGSIDYLAALNIKCSQGVTPENNAVVVLLRAAGSDYINGPPDYKKEYMNMLGVMSLPSPKHPFVYLYDYLSKHGFQWQDVDHIYGEVTRKPFTDSQYPQVGHWLDSQQDFINAYLAASQMSHWYDPITSNTEQFQMLAGFPRLLSAFKFMTESVGIDAMYDLGENDVDVALDDALAIHRLTHLQARVSAMVVQLMIAGREEEFAADIDQQIIASGLLSTNDAKRMADALGDLRPLPAFSESIDGEERYFALDALENLARGRHYQVGFLQGFGPAQPQAAFSQFVGQLLPPQLSSWDQISYLFDWCVFRVVPVHYVFLMIQDNHFYDDWMRISQAKTYDQALSEQKTLNPESRIMDSSFADDIVKTIAWRPYISNRLIQEQFAYQTILPMVRTEYALAAWHTDHGDYPKVLTALVPQYLSSVPIDPFDGQPLRYAPTANGYRLWSIGATKPGLTGWFSTGLQFTMPPEKQD